MENDCEANDQDARTIYCANLSEKITDELLFELFLQGGPIERVNIPKDKDGVQRQFGFITYKHKESVPYALAVFSGTKLFNRELRLNNRNGNSNNNRSQVALAPQPIMSNMPQMHQFHIQNPFDNLAALRSGALAYQSNMASTNDMLPRMKSQINYPNPGIDMNDLLGFSAQMLHGGNGLNVGNDLNNTHLHQSKILHRHENRSHYQNSNYARGSDRDRRDRERDRDRSDNRDRLDERERHRSDRDRGHDKRRRDRHF